jgi:hypothetical protein
MTRGARPGPASRFGLMSLFLFVAAALWFCVELFGRAHLANSGQELVMALRWMVFGAVGLACLGLGSSTLALFRHSPDRRLAIAGLILNGGGLIWLYRLFGGGFW